MGFVAGMVGTFFIAGLSAALMVTIGVWTPDPVSQLAMLWKALGLTGVGVTLHLFLMHLWLTFCSEYLGL